MGTDLKGKNIGIGFSQRKDGRYEARATINNVKIDLYNMNLSQLKKDFEIEKAKVLRKEKGVRPNLTLQDWFDEWFENCKAPSLKNEQCKKKYKSKVNNTYCDLIGVKKIEQITQMNIQTATNDLIANGYQERTIREALRVLSDCMNVAVANRIIPSNPCIEINIKRCNIAPKERRVLSWWEQNTFLEETKNSYYYEPYCILLLTGMRIGEFSGLWWSDVDFENKCVHINRSLSSAYIDGRKIEELTTPKTINSYRDIPFFGETEALFKSWKEKQDIYKKKLGDRWRASSELGDLVFTSTMGSPVTRYVIVHDIKKIEDNYNLKETLRAYKESREPKLLGHIHPHAFRHTFATRCFEKGMDSLVVQDIMGHANYSTTVSYTHILEDKMREEVSKMGNFFER